MMLEIDLEQLEDFLGERIKGQEFAMKAMASAAIRAELGLSKKGRPKSVFLLLGPTGTGKTESTLNLGRFLFGSEEVVARFDMGEYGHEDSLKRLIGENKQDAGLLGEAIDSRPSGGILLLDEIEKAHPKIAKVFLGATDAARTTSADGITRNLENWYMVFTSNLGSANAAEMDGVPYTMLERSVMQAATLYFAPETMARFTNKVVFRPLSFETQRQIAEALAAKEIRHFQSVARDRLGVEIDASFSEACITFLIRKGYTKQMGARPMRDAIEKLMGDPFSRWLLDMRKVGSKPPCLQMHFDAPESATELLLTVGNTPQVVGLVQHLAPVR
ncbi:MAG: AAA family ATPase [Verrucomicrobiota bacterium]